jgi:hypothetical protein
VLILEADVRPISAHALSVKELATLAERLRAPWSVLRPAGLFMDFKPNARAERRTPTPVELSS